MKNAASKSIIAFALLANFCHAGSAPASASKINGYFLGYQNGAYISVGSSKEYIQDIKDTCSKKASIWALGYKTALKCVGTKYVAEGGDGPIIEVLIEGLNKSQENWSSILFSTRPFPEKSWIKRESTPEEATEVIRYVNSSKANLELDANGFIKKFLFNLRPTVIEAAGATIFLVPWASTEDGTGSVNNELIILERSENSFLYTGHFAGKITGLADITGDGIPEIKISQGCDGACEYIAEISGSINILVSIYNH